MKIFMKSTNNTWVSYGREYNDGLEWLGGTIVAIKRHYPMSLLTETMVVLNQPLTIEFIRSVYSLY